MRNGEQQPAGEDVSFRIRGATTEFVIEDGNIIVRDILLVEDPGETLVRPDGKTKCWKVEYGKRRIVSIQYIATELRQMQKKENPALT
jgi:hypothetical protein